MSITELPFHLAPVTFLIILTTLNLQGFALKMFSGGNTAEDISQLDVK